MSSESAYFTFEWPNTGNTHTVYVTGTFDNWSKSTRLNLTRDGSSFVGTIEVPNEKSLFKFVVNDTWVTSTAFKVESDSNGFENNVLYPEDLVRCHDVNSPFYKSESESSAFTAVSFSELGNDPDDEYEDDEGHTDEGMCASVQETLTRRIIPSDAGSGNPLTIQDGSREIRYFSSMSMLSRFTRYFK